MRAYLMRGIAAMTAAAGMFFAAPALAGPNIHVSIPAPTIVATTPAVSVVVNRPARPGPNWVWVQGGHRVDAYGHRVWVAGHWKRITPAPTRTVVVRKSTPTHVHRRTRTVVYHR